MAKGMLVRKRLFWIIGGLLLGAALLTIAILLLVDRQQKPGITTGNFKRLHDGMEEDEAEAILGRKADHSVQAGSMHVSSWGEGNYAVYLDVIDKVPPDTALQRPIVVSGSMTFPDGTTLRFPVQQPPLQRPDSPIDRLLWQFRLK
jgi:hypothetical protein